MIPDIIRLLKRAGADIDARQLADSVWLAMLQPVPAVMARNVSNTNGLPPVEKAGSPPESHRRRSRPLSGGAEAPYRDVFARGMETTPDGTGRRASRQRFAASDGLTGRLELLRALRPLRRRFPSRSERVFDETATAEASADIGHLRLVFRAKPEPWFAVDLVIEASPSMALWQAPADGFARLLTQSGAFSEVRRWFLRRDGNEAVLTSPSGARRSVRMLAEPSGRRLVMLVSDGVSLAWRYGTFEPALRRWSADGPVVLVQVLPPRLWSRSNLGRPMARVKALKTGDAGRRLSIVSRPWEIGDVDASHRETALPAAALGPSALATWVRMLMAPPASAPAFLIAQPSSVPDADALQPETGAGPREEPLDRFRRTTSPLAYRLAACLALFPLSPPVARAVQSALLPESGPDHLAEVFLGGIVRRETPTDALCPPDMVQYEFLSGVRDRLLDTLRLGEVDAVLAAVGDYLAARHGVVLDFQTLIEDSDGEKLLPEHIQPIARISAEALQRLRGMSPKAAHSSPLRVYISCHHKDDKWQKRILTYFESLERRDIITVIHDKLISPGAAWQDVIERDRSLADAAVLVVSPAYLDSDWCREEMAYFIGASENREVRLFPLLLRPCYFGDTDLAKFQFINNADNALATLSKNAQEQILSVLVAHISDLAEIESRRIGRLNIPQDRATFRDRLLDGSKGPELVIIQAGSFLMGAYPDDSDADDCEGPQRHVFIKQFLLGRYPITFAEYDYFCDNTEHPRADDNGWGHGRLPVINISWDDANEYTQWLSSVTKHKYRLASEAEWEYACRAGTITPYWWGTREPTEKDANNNFDIQRTTKVGRYPSNKFGLFDMTGNVWEWVEDEWKGYDDSAERSGDRSKLNVDADFRVLRGGAWSSNRKSLRSAFRLSGSRYNQHRLEHSRHAIGFRVARDI